MHISSFCPLKSTRADMSEASKLQILCLHPGAAGSAPELSKRCKSVLFTSRSLPTFF